MKIAVIYKSLTGNTRLVAEAIRDVLSENVIYCGEPEGCPDADFYFIGSWTDKGMCCPEIASFLKTLENKKIAWFGTAGFGGSESYYQSLYERVKSIIPASNELTEYFYCQGKMPLSVRNRYVAMLTEHPDDQKLAVSLRNFDEALSHPDQKDLDAVRAWAQKLLS